MHRVRLEGPFVFGFDDARRFAECGIDSPAFVSIWVFSGGVERM